jgi:hypothetical protein
LSVYGPSPDLSTLTPNYGLGEDESIVRVGQSSQINISDCNRVDPIEVEDCVRAIKEPVIKIT